MAVPGDCRNTVCISKSPDAVMGKQIHSKPYESLCESAQCSVSFFMYQTYKQITLCAVRPQDPYWQRCVQGSDLPQK